MRCLLVLFVAALLATGSWSNAETLYVDDIGDGATGTGAAADPFRDVQPAIDAASDGDILMILPGTYAATPVEYVEALCEDKRHALRVVEALVRKLR